MAHSTSTIIHSINNISEKDDDEFFDARDDNSTESQLNNDLSMDLQLILHQNDVVLQHSMTEMDLKEQIPPSVILHSTIRETEAEHPVLELREPVVAITPSQDSKLSEASELKVGHSKGKMSTAKSLKENHTTATTRLSENTLKCLQSSLLDINAVSVHPLDISTPNLLRQSPSSPKPTPLSNTWPSISNLSEDKASAARALAAAQQTISERFGAETVEDPIMKPGRSPRHTASFESNLHVSEENPSTPTGIGCVSSLDGGRDESQFVRFKNLDTGEVRLLPLDIVGAAAAPSKLEESLLQRGDNFIDLFNAESETYQKLHRHLEKLAERRQQYPSKAKEGFYLNDSDEGSDNNDDENSSDDDGEDAGRSKQVQARLWSKAGSIRSLFSLSKAEQGSRLRSTPATNTREQSNIAAIDITVTSVQPPTIQPQASQYHSPLLSHHQQQSNVDDAALPVVSTLSQQDDEAPSFSVFEQSSSSTPSLLSVPRENITKVQPLSWFRRGSSIANRQPPYQLPTRIETNKEQQCLNKLWLVREMKLPDKPPIWSLSVSGDGQWIAAAVQSGTIYLWRMKSGLSETSSDTLFTGTSSSSPLMSSFETVDLSSPKNKIKENQQHNSTSSSSSSDSSFLFNDNPDMVLTGHSASIVVCRWDFKSLRNGMNRLATTSLDRTVRVWSIDSNTTSQQQRPSSIVLHCADWSTSVCFHPTIRGLLYTSALDGTIQVWRIPIPGDGQTNLGETTSETRDPSLINQWPPTMPPGGHPRLRKAEMLEFTRMSELVTAMAISPDGTLLAVGLRFGRVALYESRTLRFRAEVECRNRKGRYSSGRKVTGLVWTSDSQSICVSTSDSRIRIITINNISNWMKFKGHVTKQMMLYAHFSPSEQHLICGSESSWIFVWNVNPPTPMNSLVTSRLTMVRKKKPTNRQVEKFKAFDELLTSCLAAPDSFSSRLVNTILSISNSYSSWEFLQQSLVEGNTTQDRLNCGYRGTTNLLQSSTLRECPIRLSLNRLVIVAGSIKGTVRVFINTGHPVSAKQR